MKVFELFGELTLKGLDKADKQLTGLQGKVEKFSGGIKKAGMAMTAGGAVIVGGLGLALKSAVDFESSMREVNTMMGLGQEEFKDFSKEVQNMAADMGVSAVDSAKALYQAISAGVPKENVLTFLEVATKAAIGGVTDTETAVDGLTTIMNAFKIPVEDAQQVADVMFTTVKGGKTTFEELSASMFQVAPIAAASGVEFKEVAAALATMTKQGVPTSVATTQLRQAMVSLQKPTKEMNEVINELGYESGQTMLDELGLADSLDAFRDASGGSNELLMKMFGSVEAGSAVLALTGDNAAMFAQDLAAMDNATGAATDAFEEMENSASRQMEALKASFGDVAITVGNVLLPILKGVVDGVKPIIETIKNWIAENPKLTKVIVIVIGAIGGLMLVLGPLLIILPGLVAALPLLGAAFGVLLGPVGLVVAAIAGVIAIGVLVVKNWENIKERVVIIWNAISSFFSTVWENIGSFFKSNWDKILAILFPVVGIPILIARNWEKVKEFFKGLWENVTRTFKNAWDAIVKFIGGIPDKIGRVFSTIKDIILAPFRAAWQGIGAGLNWLIDQMNKISFEIPGWVPVIGGNKFGIDIPNITLPTFATGALISEPTLLTNLRTLRPVGIAGEAGVERLTPGAGGAGMTLNINVANLIVREEADIRKIAQKLFHLQQTKIRAAGG